MKSERYNKLCHHSIVVAVDAEDSEAVVAAVAVESLLSGAS